MRVHSVERHEADPPDDRVHRVAQAMLGAWEGHPEGEGLHVVCFVTEDRAGHSYATTAIGGYEGDTPDADAMMDVFAHLTAVFQINGMKLEVFPMPHPIGGEQ